jgi:hypothetical protein
LLVAQCSACFTSADPDTGASRVFENYQRRQPCHLAAVVDGREDVRGHQPNDFTVPVRRYERSRAGKVCKCRETIRNVAGRCWIAELAKELTENKGVARFCPSDRNVASHYGCRRKSSSFTRVNRPPA